MDFEVVIRRLAAEWETANIRYALIGGFAMALRGVLGKQLKVAFIAGEVAGESPKALTDRKLEQRQAAAVAEIREDPFVRELIEDFDGSLEDASIKPK